MSDGSVGRNCFYGECADLGRHFATRDGAALDCPLLSSFREQFQARVYSEDGELRPISATLEIPRGPSTIAVRNIGQVPRAGRDREGSERNCCARPDGESTGIRCGPVWGADGIPADCGSGRRHGAEAVPGAPGLGPVRPGRGAEDVDPTPGRPRCISKQRIVALRIDTARIAEKLLHDPYQKKLGAGTRWTRLSMPSRCSSRLVACR